MPVRAAWASNQRPPHGVHGDAVGGGVEAGQQRDDLDIRLLPQQMQRPDAVFAAAPGEKNFFHRWFTNAGAMRRQLRSAAGDWKEMP